MFDLTDAILLAIALTLIFGVIPAIKQFRENRNGNLAFPLDCFGPEYERDLLKQSALSENENWSSVPDSSFEPLRLHDPEVDEHR